ncbi:MAG: alpha/beta hydrolase [Burkholderiaceae bacterium]|nr:alpha/beta hydrolase [Burkholderiaceae bacterium]
MQLRANGITLEVESFGPSTGEPLLLIMGLGMQLLAWHEDFVQDLVATGFRVIRFDNRDVGLSQSFDAEGLPHIGLESLKYLLHLTVKSPYSLPDMALDCVGLLDGLGIASAHICGASMGGMIAQQLAARHPDRVKSLTLMMTTSGARALPGPSMKVRGALMARPPANDHAAVVASYVRLYQLIGSPAYPNDPEVLRQRIDRIVRRSHRPQGTMRQLMAIAADGDRSALLAQIQAPTQIIHGQADPLVPVAAGHDLARKIAGSRLDLIDGMGHDLPPALWPRFIANIRTAAARAAG